MLFRSGIEKEIAKQLKKAKVPYTYEKFKINYKYPEESRLYTPDFKIITRSGKEIIIEVKGIWIYSDRYKHLLVRRQYPELDIRFVFSRSKTRISKVSKTTYADICNGEGRGAFKDVIWKFSDKKIPKEWLNE
jgi:hypothetical protein